VIVLLLLLWNKVSSICPYLDSVRSSTNEGLVRVGSARFKGSLKIFAVVVSIRRCSSLFYVVATSTSTFNLFWDKIWFLQPFVLIVKDRKSALLGVFPQPMFFQRLLDLIVNNERVFLRSSKLCGDGICRCPFSCCAIAVHFSSSSESRTINWRIWPENSLMYFCFLYVVLYQAVLLYH